MKRWAELVSAAILQMIYCVEKTGGLFRGSWVGGGGRGEGVNCGGNVLVLRSFAVIKRKFVSPRLVRK